MEGHTRPLDGRGQRDGTDDAEQMGRVARTDPYSLASRVPRDNARFVHESDFADRANVWRFVITGEAFTTETLNEDQIVEYIDRVFAGEQNPTLPVVTYEVTEVNGEAYGDVVEDDQV